MKLLFALFYMVAGMSFAGGYLAVAHLNCVPSAEIKAFGAGLGWPIVLPMVLTSKMQNYCGSTLEGQQHDK